MHLAFWHFSWTCLPMSLPNVPVSAKQSWGYIPTLASMGSTRVLESSPLFFRLRQQALCSLSSLRNPLWDFDLHFSGDQWWGQFFFSFLLVICYFVEMPSLLISIVHLNKPVHFIAIEVVECCAYSSKKHSWEQHWMVMSYLPVSVTVTQYVIFCSCSFAAVFILKILWMQLERWLSH